jgi:SAM-dependent methyltransferase
VSAGVQRRHDAIQEAHWADADAEHLRWQTEGPYFAETERSLLEAAAPVGRFLEIGCGEGGNLHHLRQGPQARFGIDRYPPTLRYTKQRQPDLRLAAADAAHLPFADEAFDSILIRDLLHHVFDRRRVLTEAWRTLRVGGRLTLIEPNVRNPLILAQATTVPAERGLLRSTPNRLLDEVQILPQRGLCELSMAQPLPLARIVLHPDMGRPSLGRSTLVRGALSALDAVCRRVVPQSCWAYNRLTLTKAARPR